MANLKIDLVNRLNNDKFYAEIELVRLAQDANMRYKEKIELMNEELTEIALTNGKLGLVDQYFQEPAQQQQQQQQKVETQPLPEPQTNQQPVMQQNTVHNGQSHSE